MKNIFNTDKTKECSYNKIQILEPYLVNAFEKERKYLLALDIDRLLAGFEENAGCKTEAARYPGWEMTEIQGHTAGHYLTSLAQAYACTGDAEFAARASKICSRLKGCQREDGYLFAWPEEIFDRVEKHQPAWVPWYTMHKILAGLVAAYRHTGDANALDAAGKLGGWIYRRTEGWSEDVHKAVLAVEYGGMNDVLYELYKITGDERHLKAAHKFDEEALFEEIHNGKDILNNLHANATIPKIIGAMNRYLVTGERYYFETAENFWHMVVEHHTYITGGNSEWEHFGKPDVLNAERTACNCETCNSYNMLKLTKLLYMETGDKTFMDFYERTWLNAVLASQNPDSGMTTYFQPMETGFFKVYQEPFSDFWCCTGTGMENFTKLADAVYFQTEDTEEDALYIVRYISCRFQVPGWQVDFEMDVRFPQTDGVRLKVSLPQQMDEKILGKQLYFRIPEWTGGRVEISVNGNKEPAVIRDGYIKFSLEDILNGAADGDGIVEVSFFPQVQAHCLVDDKHTVAFTYGPVVLCAGLGKQMLDTEFTGVQVKVPTKKLFIKDYLILKEDRPEAWLAHINKNLVKKENSLSFSLHGTDADDALLFEPYYSKHNERYGIYWTLYQKNSAELKKRGKDQKKKEKIRNIAVDIIPVGNDQYELAHNIQGTNTEVLREYGYNSRCIQGKGSFQYDMAIDPDGSILAVTYSKYDAGSEFDILIDGGLLAHELLSERDHELYTKYYNLAGQMLDGKKTVTVAFRTLSEQAYCRIYQILYMCGNKQS